MKFKELKSTLAAEGTADCYLVEGEDGWLSSSAEKQIKASLNLAYEELNCVQFFGDETPFEQIWNSLQVLPFLSDKRLVVVREWYPKTADLERLADFLKSQTGSVLVVCNRKASADFKKKVPCTVVDCGKETEDVVERWTAALARSHGASLDSEAVSELCAYCLFDMSRIVSELRKLADLAQGRTLTKKDISENVAKDAEYQVYELTDSVQKRDGRAIRILDALLTQNDAGYISLVISALFSNFKRIYAVKTSPLPAAELAKTLKVKEYAVKMSAKNGARFSPEETERAMKWINDYEFAFKSGKVSADVAVRQIVLKLQTL